MNKSDTIGKLASALAKAQAALEPAKKDAKGNFGKFADLGEVIDVIRKVATPNGLSFSQFPVGDSAGVGVATILMHDSGEWLSDTIYLPTSDEMGRRNGAQIAGGNITYLRRYALASVFGVYADEDTDGQGKQPQTQAARPSQNTAQRAPVTEAPKPPLNIPAVPAPVNIPSHTTATRDTFLARAKELGMEKVAAEIATRHKRENSTWAKALEELNAIAPNEKQTVAV